MVNKQLLAILCLPKVAAGCLFKKNDSKGLGYRKNHPVNNIYCIVIINIKYKIVK